MSKLKESERKKLQQFARDCLKIRSYFYLGTRALTPINYREEKEKFENSNTYNPQFTYNRLYLHGMDEDIKKLHQELEILSLPDDLKNYLKNYIKDTEMVEKAVRLIGSDEFGQYAEKVFDLNSPELQNLLNESPDITITDEEKTKLYNAEEIAEIFRQVLSEKYNITNYEIQIDHFNDHIIRVGKNKVVLGEKIKRYKKSIERLIIHELESHVLQRINADKDPILNLTTYAQRTLFGEGLAVYNEVQNEKLTLKMYKLYSLRLKAVRLIDQPFRKIYDELADSVPPHIAYQITYRVKRGMADTSLPGGYPKDAFYLLGYMAVRDYIEEGNQITSLYTTRVPQLNKLVKKYNLVDSRKTILPDFLT